MELKGKTITWLVVSTMALFAISGCHPARPKEPSSAYGEAAFFLNKHIDSFYTNPDWIALKLDSIKKNSSDSSAFQLASLYYSFYKYLKNNNSKATLEDIEKVGEYCRRHEEDYRLLASYWNMRSIFSDSFDSTVYYLERARHYAEQAGSSEELFNVVINLADIYRISGKLPEAARYWRRALGLVDSVQSKESKANILIGLAQTYSDMGRYDMADQFFGMADSTVANMKSHYLLSMAKGNSYYSRRDYYRALLSFRKALGNLGETKTDFQLLPIYADLAEVYTLTEHYDSALHYLSMARRMMDGSIVVGTRYYIYSLSADLAFRMHRNDEAERYLDSLKQCGNVSRTYQYLHKRRMMMHYARLGNYKEAYEYRDEMDQYDDSIRDMQQQANLAEIDYRYNRDTTLLRQQLLLSESNEKVLNGQIALTVTIALLVVFVAIAVAYIMQRRRKTEAMRFSAHNRIAQLRMQGVRNRVTPHLILNAIHSARLSDADPVYEQLVDVLRDNLTLGDNIDISIDEEVRIVEHYVELYRMTHAACPTLTINRDESVTSLMRLPAMSIQIPVENSLKHAFSSEDTDRQVEVRLYYTDSTLHVRVSDNGCGYKSDSRTATKIDTGNGIRILYQTYDVLNQFNSQHIRFEIVSPIDGNRGTRVELDVPQNYNYTFKTDSIK